MTRKVQLIKAVSLLAAIMTGFFFNAIIVSEGASRIGINTSIFSGFLFWAISAFSIYILIQLDQSLLVHTAQAPSSLEQMEGERLFCRSRIPASGGSSTLLRSRICGYRRHRSLPDGLRYRSAHSLFRLRQEKEGNGVGLYENRNERILYGNSISRYYSPDRLVRE